MAHFTPQQNLDQSKWNHHPPLIINNKSKVQMDPTKPGERIPFRHQLIRQILLLQVIQRIMKKSKPKLQQGKNELSSNQLRQQPLNQQIMRHTGYHPGRKLLIQLQ
jgi:CRISPR/Cas system endoribonuclease Cas6 (RAMP superfamily)